MTKKTAPERINSDADVATVETMSAKDVASLMGIGLDTLKAIQTRKGFPSASEGRFEKAAVMAYLVR